MKPCEHTRWLSIEGRSGKPTLAQSDRLEALVRVLPCPDLQRPHLFVLIGHAEKTVAAQVLFGLKKARAARQRAGEIHLHVDASTAFTDRPTLLVDCDARLGPRRSVDATESACHETQRHALCHPAVEEATSDDVCAKGLAPFAEVFCVFSDDLGGLRCTARRLARWLEKDLLSPLSKPALPSVIVVTSDFFPKGQAEAEAEVKKAFLLMLAEETSRDPYQHVSAIDVVALLPCRAISAGARCRRLKERIARRAHKVRQSRAEQRLLFCATHLAAFLNGVGARFASAARVPFDFVKAARAGNPLASDLVEHLSRFLKHVASSDQLTQFAAPTLASSLFLDSHPPDAHAFDPRLTFATLYRPLLRQACERRVIDLEGTKDVVLRSGLISVVEKSFVRCFERYVRGETAVDIHRNNLARVQGWWHDIQSSSTCLCCLRRRPQYGLPCGHCICENCVVVFGDRSENDPWLFYIDCCFLCGETPSTRKAVRVHPPTAGAGVLCIDGGGTRGIVPLVLMRRIHDRIGLPIPLQRYVKVAIGVSIGAVIAIDHCINGRPLSESIQMFPGMMERVFKRRTSFGIPFVSRAFELASSYFADGLYPTHNIESVLKEALGADGTIADCSAATSTGTKVCLPVATVSRHPSYQLFTNYNGVGVRDSEHDRSIIKPMDGAERVPLWKINRARAVSAAPVFFAPQHIDNVGTFQDPGLLENDPILWALSEVAALFPQAETPDFVVSLGTGEPGPSNYELSTDDRRSIRQNGMLQRLKSLAQEKTRDKVVRRVCTTVGLAGKTLQRIHRLNVDFHGVEPRLDDTGSIPELVAKVEADASLHPKIDAVARCLVASLFYFKLDSSPQRRDGMYSLTGRILCSIVHGDPSLEALLNKLVSSRARFLVNDCFVSSPVTHSSLLGKDCNVFLPVNVKSTERLAISLQLDESGACNISGSPFMVSELITAQGLNAAFGRPDHRKRTSPEHDTGPARKRRRLLPWTR